MSDVITTAEFPAWGGLMRVAVTDPAALDAALRAVEQTVDVFDHACSSFREDSELARLNAAAGEPSPAGAVLLDAVEAALRAARLTDGAVDPTVGGALVAHGFNPALTGGREGFRITAVPGYDTVVVDRAAGTIRIGRGVTLDLGATAKALAADRSAAAAHRAAASVAPGAGVLVSLMGDLAIAGDPPPGGWTVRVTDDHRAGEDAPGQTITLDGGGLATSSTTVRRRDGDRHHVLDPRTGRPAGVHFRTVSVAAASCLDANIASTAAIVRGAAAVDWLGELGLPARLVTAAGDVLHLAGWPQDDDDLAAVTPIGRPA